MLVFVLHHEYLVSLNMYTLSFSICISEFLFLIPDVFKMFLLIK